MNFKTTTIAVFAMLSIIILGPSTAVRAEENYYTEPILFHYNPSEDGARWTIGRFGPVGLSLELLQPAFTMRITGVEDGSPAAATGKLESGQFIESINGQVLKDIDPRIILGNLITEAEAADGKLVMMIKDTRDSETYPVTVQLPVLGAYSDTWPMNCEKSDAIVRNMADYLAESDRMGWGAALFLLSTGEEKDLDVVRRWYSENLRPDSPGFPWSIGYTGPAITEYYLRTGDESVLPAIQSRADYLRDTIYNGSWMGRGGANFRYMSGGHMNAAGAPALTFLLMAKECGVDVDEQTLQSALTQFFRFAGRGNVAYGDQMPEGGFTDNGKVGKLAFTMQAAANLVPDGENSVYAKARDISATKSFYSTSWLFHGHTGGGIGELWRGPAMGLVRDKRPLQYRSFMDERRWMYELARTHEGAFGWSAGQNVNYTRVNAGRPSGNYIPLIYTLPRQQLRMFGAPPTQYSQTYELPERPWGTAADDVFYSLTPGETADGQQLDISQETIRTGASRALNSKMSDPDATEELLHQYALHIDQTIRSSAVGRIKQRGWDHIFMELLQSDDPRGRHSGVMGVSGSRLTDEVAALLVNMVKDPDESWWVVHRALQALGHATPDQLVPHVDHLEKWLTHGGWWLRSAALQALTPLVTDERVYRDLLPKIGSVMAKEQRPGTYGAFRGMVNRLRGADPEVQSAAVDMLAAAYTEFPEQIAAPGAQDMSRGTDYMLRHLASTLADIPGGLDQLYRVSQKRYPGKTLRHREQYMEADDSEFSPELREAFNPIVLNELIPEYIVNNRWDIFREARWQKPGRNRRGELPRLAISKIGESGWRDSLTDLHRRVGIDDYNWQPYGPARDAIEWQYHTFSADGGNRHFKEVTLPADMENWMDLDFDASAAGWRTGRAPFAYRNGQLQGLRRNCRLDFCRCGDTPNTLWEDEILLMRTTLELPALDRGNLYRFLVGGRSHNRAGESYIVYVNGEPVYDVDGGTPNRNGALPAGFLFHDAMEALFADGEVTIAIQVSRGNSGYFTAWIEQMEMPPLGVEQLQKAAQVRPLRSSEYVETMDEDETMLLWDGQFKRVDGILGTWKLVDQVDTIEDFDPENMAVPDPRRERAPRNRHYARRHILKDAITFHADGSTEIPNPTGNQEVVIWSGNLLLDLGHREALQMQGRKVDGTMYLFIESGGFPEMEDRDADWKPPLLVYAR